MSTQQEQRPLGKELVPLLPEKQPTRQEGGSLSRQESKSSPRPQEREGTEERKEQYQDGQEAPSVEGAIAVLKQKLRKPKKQKSTTIPQIRDKFTIHIEHILEEGLSDAYNELDPVQKQEFKIQGEKTAFEIQQLLKSTHVKVKKIFRLILEWLRLLPGINRFFLEQEAKIKADKIISLKR